MELNDAMELIKIARESIKSKKIVETRFKEKRGAFVTLHTFPEKRLRGCIGFIEPIFQLGEAIQRAAIAAAYSDPRFQPLSKEEINKVIIEISILSKPKEIKVEELKQEDGAILEFKGHKGVFLPQVWEELPNKEDFLNALCLKAGLPPYCWKENIKLYKFSVEAFEEEKPNGEVKRVKI
ncbi:MAG: AmmeMemoRadiSam system protein A [Nanoarchaeota archaeon]|nr:AmmeMemoRadiSam system protein A [Nanoarchaeota archaeon]